MTTTYMINVITEEVACGFSSWFTTGFIDLKRWYARNIGFTCMQNKRDTQQRIRTTAGLCCFSGLRSIGLYLALLVISMQVLVLAGNYGDSFHGTIELTFIWTSKIVHLCTFFDEIINKRTLDKTYTQIFIIIVCQVHALIRTSTRRTPPYSWHVYIYSLTAYIRTKSIVLEFQRCPDIFLRFKEAGTPD